MACAIVIAAGSMGVFLVEVLNDIISNRVWVMAVYQLTKLVAESGIQQ